MKNLLVGNGVNIQFSGKEYTNKEIILRMLRGFDRPDYPTHIIIDEPYLLKIYLGKLFLEARSAIQGKYDQLIVSNIESESLTAVKKHYKDLLSVLTISDIGFEDYYLIHELFCRKEKINYSEIFKIRQGLRLAYLYAIFNDGNLNQLYQNYKDKYIEYLKGFDKIFTTNYDSNIEKVVKCHVFHIHGAFDKLDSVYDPYNPVNNLVDSLKQNIIDTDYYYLYSNALTTFCGKYKEFQIMQNSLANGAIIKFSEGYKTDDKIKAAVEGFLHDENRLVRRLGEFVKIKVDNPDFEFSEDYHFDEFLSLNGELEILGLSPWNDFHIFEAINKAKLNKCIYYFYNFEEIEEIKILLPDLIKNNSLEFFDAKLFWGKYNEK